MNEYLLTETGDFLLQENSDKIVKGVSGAPQGRETCDRELTQDREIAESRDTLETRSLV